MKTISIVIPVYNEAEHLEACLEAIACLRPFPLEVIVVDNNSTDESAELASRFSFVTLLHESRQGVVHARNQGFNAACGDIIGRIDADTVLPPDWVNQVRQILADDNVSAVSGSAHYYDFGLSKIADTVDSYCRLRLANSLKDNNYLWGANMAIRRSAWLKVSSQLCNKALIHEDFDLAIHLQKLGLTVKYDQNLTANVSSRRIDSSFMDYIRYTLRSPRTYAAHGLRSRRHMYPIVAICWAAYLPGRLIYRGYDPMTQTFSLTQLLSNTASRVDPTTNVI
jgi:cellulose synthase/poly-beta-1,6-N-acetylglucosamine synthase-like glycosyltransferase